MPGSFHNSDNNENDANRTIIYTRTTDLDTPASMITPASTAEPAGEAPAPARTLYPRVPSTSSATEKPLSDLQRAMYTSNRLRAERNHFRDIATGHEEELGHTHLENERLQAEFSALRDEFNSMKAYFREEQAAAGARAPAHSHEEPRRSVRVATVDTEFTNRTHLTAATVATDRSTVATWRPRGKDPKKSLSGMEPDDYKPWRYRVDRKLTVDSPIYPTDLDKIDYALTQMVEPLFSAIQGWVAESADESSVTYAEAMDEVEHFMNIHLEENDANKELLTTKQRQGESVTQYYHRIRPLWQKAKTSEHQRIEKFLTTIHPRLSVPLVGRDFDSVRELLDNARKVEDRKKDIHFNHPRLTQRPDYPQRADSETAVTGKGTLKAASPRLSYRPAPGTKNDTGTASAPRTSSSGNLNARFGPVATKPNGWSGIWHDPVQKPGRMDSDEKATMIRQGRCWRCRGSGHRSHDPCCPARQTNLDVMTTGEFVDGESSGEDSAHASGKV